MSKYQKREVTISEKLINQIERLLEENRYCFGDVDEFETIQEGEWEDRYGFARGQEYDAKENIFKYKDRLYHIELIRHGDSWYDYQYDYRNIYEVVGKPGIVYEKVE